MSTDVDATLAWGGVGCGGDVSVPSTAFLRPSQDVDATLRVPSGLHTMLMLQMLMLRSHGVGWGDLGVRVSHHVPHCMLLLLMMMMMVLVMMVMMVMVMMMMMIPSNSSRRGANGGS